MGDRSILADGVNCYNMAYVEIGNDVIVSQRAHLCAGTHDYDDPNFQLIARPIAIGSGSWIAAEAFIGPGVVVEERVVLGARGVAFSRLESWSVYAGNPATIIRKRRPPGQAQTVT